MSSEASFLAAMELCDLAPVLVADLLRDRELAETRRLWAKLKKPWAARRA
jgi:hypothetical protein